MTWTIELMSISGSAGDSSIMAGSSAGSRFCTFFLALILPSGCLFGMAGTAQGLALGGRSAGLLCDPGNGESRQVARTDEGHGGSVASYREGTVRPAAKRAPTLSSQYRVVSEVPFHPLVAPHSMPRPPTPYILSQRSWPQDSTGV